MGWQSCPFLVTPDELKTAFEPFRLVINNACVPIDYTDTPVEEFLENYSALYERLIGGGVIAHKTEGKLLSHIAITSHLSDLKFGMEHEIGGKMVKAVIADKKISPLPYLAPFTFNMYTENNKLYVSTRYSYLAYTESVLGYEIIFRKFSQSDVEYFGLASEKEFKTYPDYALFKKTIMKMTKPLIVQKNGIVKRTAVRVSDEVRQYLPDFYCIKSKEIEIL